MSAILQSFEQALSREDLIRATSRIVEQKLRTEPLPLMELAGMRIESLDDIESWIDRIGRAIASAPLIGSIEEERAHRLLSYLLIASIRARQLS
ncbi:MAG TPA: hypothetical protein VEC19_08505 [Usitatibacter sp.]|nr:hypothetical protein [Usitatibacter sp.]